MRKSSTFLLLPLLFLFVWFLIPQIPSLAVGTATVDTTVKVSVCGNTIKEGSEQCDGADLGGKACSSLGFDGGILACDAACDFDSSACTTAAEASAKACFLGSAGGSYTLSNSGRSLQLTVPAGFHTKDACFYFFSYPNVHFSSSKAAPSGLSFVGKTFEIIAADEDGASVSTFQDDLSLKISYLDTDVGNLAESTFTARRWGSGDSSWHSVPNSTVNTGSNFVTFNTEDFSSFALFGSTPTPTPGGGGGGGGGVVLPPSGTTVILKGFGPRDTAVTVLKDGQIATTIQTGTNGAFTATLTDISAGSYLFGFFAETDDGRTVIFTFSLNITAGTTTTASDIILPPTLKTNAQSVSPGTSLIVSGIGPPNAPVEIAVDDGARIVTTTTNTNGRYSTQISTQGLTVALHTFKARVMKGTTYSIYSSLVPVGVGIPGQAIACAHRPDVNDDNRVNLVDFSILAYWFKRPLPANSPVDLNCDGSLSLADFSILAFNWSG